MRTMHLSKRQCRLLRENLTNSQEGYDYLDLVRLDALAKKLTALQGPYAELLAESTREEKKIRRKLARTNNPMEIDALNKQLLALRYDLEDADEEAEQEIVELRVEDGDYRLIDDKIKAVPKWVGADSIRTLILGLVESIRLAEPDGEVTEPVSIERKRK